MTNTPTANQQVLQRIRDLNADKPARELVTEQPQPTGAGTKVKIAGLVNNLVAINNADVRDVRAAMAQFGANADTMERVAMLATLRTLSDELAKR